ncbi:hypothetical protein HNY73_001777 [Argiope bruennichi]|uniref:Uncharacterized protein n=1 Tax=Argiope bruennichi TaxID=94029 RepID=A0A8T0FSX5_ARGBR|nr:hypothetical protein HNY73_001777 [Argiope bruennichi]
MSNYFHLEPYLSHSQRTRKPKLPSARRGNGRNKCGLQAPFIRKAFLTTPPPDALAPKLLIPGRRSSWYIEKRNEEKSQSQDNADVRRKEKGGFVERSIYSPCR